MTITRYKEENEIIECSLGITKPLEKIACVNCEVENYLPADRAVNPDELCAVCNKGLRHREAGTVINPPDGYNILNWDDSFDCPDPNKTCQRGSIVCTRCKCFGGKKKRATLCSYSPKPPEGLMAYVGPHDKIMPGTFLTGSDIYLSMSMGDSLTRLAEEYGIERLVNENDISLRERIISSRPQSPEPGIVSTEIDTLAHKEITIVESDENASYTVTMSSSEQTDDPEIISDSDKDIPEVEIRYAEVTELVNGYWRTKKQWIVSQEEFRIAAIAPDCRSGTSVS